MPAGWIVAPGLIDIHVHLREPGQEHKETIATGTASAVAGGFTAVACMPNTDPINDHAGITQFILKKAAEADLARVYPIGAVSLGSQGRAAGRARRAEGRRLRRVYRRRPAGGDGAADAPGARVRGHARRADHRSLRGSRRSRATASRTKGYYASALGLRGIPGVAESLMVERDVSLAELTGAHVHIAHMSARQSLRAVRAGKERGVRVTCEVAPHHFTLTDEALDGPVKYDTNLKMNPPLRERADRDAMLDGHRRRHRRRDRDRPRAAPRRREDGRVRPRAVRHRRARDGVPLVFDRLVHTGRISRRARRSSCCR